MINRRQGGRRRVDTRFRVEQEGVNAFDLDLRQSDEARVRPVESELPQSRARKYEAGGALRRPFEPRREFSVERLDADGHDPRRAIVEDDWPAGANFADRSLHVDHADGVRHALPRGNLKHEHPDPGRLRTKTGV